MKKFETKAIFFRRPLNEFTSVQEHCSYPLAIFGGFVNKQHSWFQYTPQFGPAFQGTTNLEDKQLQLYLGEANTKTIPLNKMKIEIIISFQAKFIRSIKSLSRFIKDNTKVQFQCSLFYSFLMNTYSTKG